MMSENIYAEPGIPNKVHLDHEGEESVVDIYVSAESLRVYDNPWVESTSPDTPGPQHTASVAGEDSDRSSCVRSDSVFQRVVFLLLLAGILALICLGVQMKKEKSLLTAENTDLRRIRDQLRANNTELTEEVDLLRRTFCGKKPKKKCMNLDP